MKTSSAKAKGREGQKEIVRKLINHGYPPGGIFWRSMGAQGSDIFFDEGVGEKIPFALEVKRVERLDLNKAISQAKATAEREDMHWAVVHRRNREPDWKITLDFDTFIEILKNSDIRRPKIERRKHVTKKDEKNYKEND